MMGLDHMLDQFMVKWYQMVFGSRIQGYANPSAPSTYLSTLIANLFAQGSGRRRKECVCVCVFVVSSAWVSASKVKLWWAEVGILEDLLPTFIPWKSKPKCQVLPSDLARERQSKGNRRQKTPFKQVHLSYQGGRGRKEQAIPMCFLFTSGVLTCWQTPHGVMRSVSLSPLPVCG